MRRPALLLALLAVVVLAAVAGASPQPSPICGFCGGSFESAAEDHGVNATVAESRVTVQVHENGSATWTVRNSLGNGSDRFREDPSRLADVGRTLADGSPGVVDEARFGTARMDGDTAVLVYRDPAAAQRHAGLLVVDYLHHEGYEQWYVVNAEMFTISGPDGTTVTNDPASGQVDGRSVIWEGTTERAIYEAPTLSGYPYVVFGPDRSAGTTARTTAAVLLASAPLVVDRVTTFLLLQTFVFTVVLGIVAAGVRRRGPEVDVEPLAGLLAVLGGLGGLGLAAVYGIGSVPGPAAFGVLVGALAVFPRTRRYLRSSRRQGLVAVGALVAVWAALVAVYAATGAYDDPATVALRSSALALPFAAMLPLGGALDGDARSVLTWGGTAGLAFAATAPLVVNFAAPRSGFGDGLAAIAFLLAAVVFPVVGALVVTLGRKLSEDRSTDPAPTRRLDDV